MNRSIVGDADVKQALIEGLLHDAIAHEAGHYNEVGAQFEAFERLLTEADGYTNNQVSLAYDFWDGWIDAHNHDWRFYEPIQEADWPRLARHIVHAPREDREITEPIVLDRFQRMPQLPLIERLAALFRRR
jgi:hypothetical protein